MAEQAMFIDILRREVDVTYDVVERIALKVEPILQDTGIGEYDGDTLAVDGSHARLYFYGPDADTILISLSETLRTSLAQYSVGAYLRYGDVDDPSAVEKTIRLFGWQ